ncbi:IAA-amino acid hydrolase ILR1-like 1 [Tetrabaena socialis]|uniref:IAA-amino acid hydrolase ILR1-like 1 n=1 Tax=Tetrabaena socialis TaxID=47790 RepID=A0A2J8ADP1_9CHLO|nr:IAA-amino acid hydrolase ILR1-like 1 [Tetrabaena socialis]|eukprot:PNH10626.1 IAA-amino acid hydrolase ILR1-like 1 [Tetrabaena socialis]
MHELVLRTASSLLRAGAAGAPAAAAAAAAPTAVELIEPSLAAEDFSFYGDAVPQTAFTFLGTGDAALGTDVGLHSPRFRLDERQLPVGAALHAAIALEWLAEREAASGGSGRREEEKGEETRKGGYEGAGGQGEAGEGGEAPGGRPLVRGTHEEL